MVNSEFFHILIILFRPFCSIMKYGRHNGVPNFGIIQRPSGMIRETNGALICAGIPAMIK